MKEYQIRPFKKTDAKEAADLIRRTYQQCCAQDATPEANQEYLDHFDSTKRPQAELESIFNKTPISFVATHNQKIVGIIRGRQDQINNLFVDRQFHRQGIANKLVQKFESEVRRHGRASIKITSSLYAVPFYESVGYKKSTGIRNHQGIKTQPMKKVLK